jgi:hypothetical protein
MRKIPEILRLALGEGLSRRTTAAATGMSYHPSAPPGVSRGDRLASKAVSHFSSIVADRQTLLRNRDTRPHNCDKKVAPVTHERGPCYGVDDWSHVKQVL